MMANLIKMFKDTMSSAQPGAAPSTASPEAAATDLYASLTHKMGQTLQSLEEVGQRLTRILAALKQGKGMSPEEITRRLGTLSSLLVDRVGQLSAIRKDLAQVNPASVMSGTTTGPNQTGADGLFMLVWRGAPLAVPTSSIVSMYPLTKQKAMPLMDKTVITLGKRPVERLPLKEPKAGAQKALPTWLAHLKLGNKDFFLLADRSMGYRKAPEGVDLTTQTRIKIGSTQYVLVNESGFGAG
jgi:hypothetical protein